MGNQKIALAVGFIGSVAILVINLQPFFIGSAAESFGFTEVELGYLGSWPLIASFALFLSVPLWLFRFTARRLFFCGWSVAMAGLIPMFWANSLTFLISTFIVYTVGTALTQLAVLIVLGKLDDPESAFGIYTAMMVILAGVLAFVIPAVLEPWFGYTGLVAMLFVATSLSFFVIPAVPAEISLIEDRQPGGSVGGHDKPSIAGSLVALIAFYAGVMGAWAFMERLGVDAGLSGHTIGVSFALGLLLSGAGALVAARYGNRISVTKAGLFATFMFALFVGFAVVERPGVISYGVAVIAFNIAWAFSVPFLLAVVSKVDESGRAISMAPAAMAFGAAMGPMLAGLVLSRVGEAGLILNFALLVAVSFSLLLWVDGKTRKRGVLSSISPAKLA